MAGTTSDFQLTENPLIREVLAKGGASAQVLWGYIGPSPRDGYIALHPSLRNLSVSIEIAEGDILHVAEVPEAIFPFGAKVVWIRASAPVASRTVEKATTLADSRPAGGAVEVTKGRLRMRVASRALRSDCHSPCQTCHCPCSICVSICQVTLPE